jgi:hypothetical protein
MAFLKFFLQGLYLGAVCAVPLVPVVGWLVAMYCTRFISDYSENVWGFWILGMFFGALLGMVSGFWLAIVYPWWDKPQIPHAPLERLQVFPKMKWIARAFFIVLWTIFAVAAGTLAGWLVIQVTQEGCPDLNGFNNSPPECNGQFMLVVGVASFLLASSAVIWIVCRPTLKA